MEMPKEKEIHIILKKGSLTEMSLFLSLWVKYGNTEEKVDWKTLAENNLKVWARILPAAWVLCSEWDNFVHYLF